MDFTTKTATIFPLLLIVSCTHTATIEIVEQYYVSDIPDYTGLPSYYGTELASLNNEHYKDGFQCLVFSSNLDLGKIARNGDMNIIYYGLYICGSSDFFFTDPIYPIDGEDDQVFYYTAYLPENLLEYEMDFLRTTKEELLVALEERGACFSIGAGAMGGAELQSNQIMIDIP